LQRTRKAAAPASLTPAQATRAIKDALVTELRETQHIREQMSKPERDFTMTDVRNVVRYGVVRRPGELDVAHGTYAYRMEGHDVEGRPLHIVFTPGRDHVKLITGVRP
jgi:uncharacterized protein DUF4258